jgi:2-polyprenyl-3-methyl-5-hydroxy-6-metoxy-1,4-benzoquinol methylase
MANLKKIEQYIDQMVALLLKAKKECKGTGVANNRGSNKARRHHNKDTQLTGVEHLKNASFADLKREVEDGNWPQAVNGNLICDPHSEADKEERGRGVIELMVEEDLKGLKFLDYGCGEGHCAALAADYQPDISVGYDLVDKWNESFNDRPSVVMTTDLEEVKRHAPYDVILLFDVLDHVEGEDPVSMLKKLSEMITDKGKVYMRCHPFTSRHATHLYHDLNRAYLHLVFTEEEMKDLVPNSEFEETNIGVNRPMATYAQYIREGGFKELNRREITEKVEPFFQTSEIARRISKATKSEKFPNFQLSIQFIDYVLGKRLD